MEKESQLTVQQYFDKVKEAKQKMTEVELDRLAENSLKMLEKFLITGQTEAARKVYVNLKTFEKEKQLLAKGLDIYIWKDYLDHYIEDIANKDVKVAPLTRYTRMIPDELIDRIAETKDLFTDYFVVFTDYTGREERKIETEERNRDPILLGAFIEQSDKHDIDFVERMYYLGDWIDEYCDLTLDKLITEYEAAEGIDPTNKIHIPTDQEELAEFMKEQLKHGE